MSNVKLKWKKLKEQATFFTELFGKLELFQESETLDTLNKISIRLSEVENFAQFALSGHLQLIDKDLSKIKTKWYEIRKGIDLKTLPDAKLKSYYRLLKWYCDNVCPYMNNVKQDPLYCTKMLDYLNCVTKEKSEAFKLLKERKIDPYS